MAKMSDFRRAMERSSKRAVTEMHDLAIASHGNYGTHNKKRLASALKTMGLHHLIGKTLLTPSVHAEHSNQLGQRYLKRLEYVQQKAARNGKPRGFDSSSEFRFLTLIHCLEAPSLSRVYKAIEKLRHDLTEATETSVGIWLLGAIEVEVISMDMMRQIAANRSVAESRKADVCEGLLEQLPRGMQELKYYFLVHFHGIVQANNSRRFADYEENIRRYKTWRCEPRQIELKRLSEHFAGKKKSARQNLLDIARYITKGGNDWVGSKAYLRYKLSFDNEIIETEDGWISRNRTRNAELRREHQEEGLTDPLAMTVQEISDLATIIDNMMSQTRNRTGYLVHTKSKRKLTTTASDSEFSVKPVTLKDFLIQNKN